MTGTGERGRGWVARTWHDRDARLALFAFAGSAVFIFALEGAFRPRALLGVYFQECSSEHLMQTVSVADLRDEPWRSLFYLHIQPPALDVLRALSVRRHPGTPDGVLVREVDADLYRVWGLVYAGLIALVCRWLAGLASRPVAAAGAVLFALHPAVLFYSTLLDSTVLGAALLTWLCFELWRWSVGAGSVVRLAGAAIASFLTRSVFQWPLLLVLLACLLLLRVPWRKAAAVLAMVAVVMALYIGKQYWVFKMTMTSSFAAYNFCRGLDMACRGTTPVALPRLPPPERAKVLARKAKVDGQYNYNQIEFLQRSFAQMAEYRAALRQQRPGTLLAAWRGHLADYLLPSSRYTAHLIVDRLPWRSLYDWIFSGWRLAILLALAGLAGLREAGLRRGLALGLPVAYVAVVTLVFEGQEHLRYKFFIEPVLFVLLVAQASRLWPARAAVRPTSPS